MITAKFTINAGQTVPFYEFGTFVRVLAASADLTVRVYKNGTVLSDSPGVSAGFAEGYEDPFDKVEIYSATTQTIQVVIRFNSMVYYDQAATGNVNLGLPVQGTGSNTQKTVSNASAQLVAINAARKYLLIQNNDPSGNIFINFGATATATNGVKIAPGGSYEMASAQLTAAINAIGDIASNANIIVVEG